MGHHTPREVPTPTGSRARNTFHRTFGWVVLTLCAWIFAGCNGQEDESAISSDSMVQTTADMNPNSARNEGRDDALSEQASSFTFPDDWDRQHPILSPNAKVEAYLGSLAEKEIVFHPADGGGRAWLVAQTSIDTQWQASDWRRADGPSHREDPSPPVPVSTAQKIELVFEVGPLGIREGGILYVMPEPFWSWSEAQAETPYLVGYTTATARLADVELVPMVGGGIFRVEGRALEPGEQIDIVLGAGSMGTIVDEFAGREAEILVAVDADGDGTRRWIEKSARLHIGARAGTRIIALGPADVAPGSSIELNIAIVDERGNRALWPDHIREPNANDDRVDLRGDRRVASEFEIDVIQGPSLEMLGLNPRVELDGPAADAHRIRFTAPNTPDTIRLVIRGRGALADFESVVNPIVVRNSKTRLIWADLHGHTGLSDGTGTPEDYFRYAREIARLDAIALTDHDHWGVRPIDEFHEIADRILTTSERFHDPGRFVTIPGYEWTSWLHGHRHVLYFDEDVAQTPIYSSIDPATDRPDELWDALRGRNALTFAHHSAGEPVATNWFFPPDPLLEPLTEISSIHGMSEADDVPIPVAGAIPGNFVRDVLLRGARLGFIGSGDSHDGHPGLAKLAAGDQGGLAGIFTTSLDRKGLLGAMRARHTFATNGIRPWLSVSIDATAMGGGLAVSSTAPANHRLHIRYEATAPILRIDLIRSGRVALIDGDGALSLDFERIIPPLVPGDFHYVRIIQEGGGVAWSSPIFADRAELEIAPNAGSPDN